MNQKILFVLLLLIGMACKRTSNPSINGPVQDNCNDVPKLVGKEYKNDAKAASELIKDFSAAASIDLTKIKSLEDLNAKVEFASKLSQTLNQNVEISSTVSDEFWEQELAFRQIICLYKSIIDDPNVSEPIKGEYHKGILEFSKQRLDFQFYKKKRNG
ncbi:hypothetical protein [Ekhidna sp.]